MALRNPNLYVDYRAALRLRQFTNNAYDPKQKKPELKEISGMGLVYPTTNGGFLLEEVMLMPQRSGWAHTDFDQGRVLDLMNELITDGREDVLEHLWLWWHSHVNGGTEPSSIDTDTIERWHEGGQGKLLTLVTNIHGEMTARYDQWSPLRLSVPLETEVWVPYIEEGLDEIRKEIDSNVSWDSWTWSYRGDKDKDLNRDKGRVGAGWSGDGGMWGH